MSALGEKIEEGFVALLRGSIANVDIEPGTSSSSVTLPFISCSFEGAEELHAGAGNYWCNVIVQVTSEALPESGNRGDVEHDALFAKVCDVLHVASLRDDLNTASTGLLVVGVKDQSESERNVESRGEIEVFTNNYTVMILAGHE